MADKGFLIAKDLQKVGCTLNIPHFMNSTGQFAPEEVADNQKIASVRIHVERAIRNIKTFNFFNGTIPLSCVGSLPQKWTVAVLLTNFRKPLVKKYLKCD